MNTTLKQQLQRIDRDFRDKGMELHKVRPWRYVARYPYAWPGGYTVNAVTDDGGVLCSDCVREEYCTVAHDSRRDWRGSGWNVVGIITGADTDESMPCDHCGKELSDYCEDE